MCMPIMGDDNEIIGRVLSREEVRSGLRFAQTMLRVERELMLNPLSFPSHNLR